MNVCGMWMHESCSANWTDSTDAEGRAGGWVCGGEEEGVSLNKRPDRCSAKVWRGTAAVGSEKAEAQSGWLRMIPLLFISVT